MTDPEKLAITERFVDILNELVHAELGLVNNLLNLQVASNGCNISVPIFGTVQETSPGAECYATETVSGLSLLNSLLHAVQIPRIAACYDETDTTETITGFCVYKPDIP